MISGPAATIGLFENGCRSEVYRARGDHCRESAANTLVAVGIASLVASTAVISIMTMGLAVPPLLVLGGALLTGWGAVVGVAGSESLINWRCSNSVLKEYLSDQVVIGDGAKVRDLLDAVSAAGDSLGYAFSTHVGIEGPARGRLSMPIGWITADTTTIDETAAITFAPDTLQWFSVSSRASNLAAGFDTTVTAASGLWPKKLEVRATKAGFVYIGIGVRGSGAGSTSILLYPSISVTDSTRAWVTFGAEVRGYPLLVDYNNDGQVDARFYPDGVTTAVGDLPVPSTPRLHQNQPNPFNPRTVIAYELPAPGTTRLTIYDVKGRLVSHLADLGVQSAGRHEAIWDGLSDEGTAQSSGVYFCRLEAGSYVQTIKLALLK
jgi:hypothetical protein